MTGLRPNSMAAMIRQGFIDGESIEELGARFKRAPSQVRQAISGQPNRASRAGRPAIPANVSGDVAGPFNRWRVRSWQRKENNSW